jgi:hypothetical protein
VHAVDLSNGKGKFGPNYTETIGATALGRPGAFRSGYVGRACEKVGRWGLSIVAFLAVSRDFL